MPLIVLAIACGLYAVCALQVARAVWSATGSFNFPLDDTYITMTLAKNLALHGVMGISPTRFVSATSCPGFLLLLAGSYRLLGPSMWCPLALSLGFGLLALFRAQRLLAGLHWGIQLAALVAVVWFTPLYVIGLLGMEHTLHLALVLTFLHLTGNTLSGGKFPSWGLFMLASAMVSVRFESLFVIACACLLFLFSRQVKAAVLLGIAAAIPLLAYSLVAVTLHSYWLPQSISLKGMSGGTAAHSPQMLVLHLVLRVIQAPYMGVLLALLCVLVASSRVRADRRVFSMLVIVLGSFVLHLAFAEIGWVYRYEAYLVASAIVAIACAIPYLKISRTQWANAALLAWMGAIFLQLVLATVYWIYPREIYVLGASALAIALLATRVKLSRAPWATAAVLVLGPFAAYLLTPRTLEANRTFPLRSSAVYSQQLQMARFLHGFEQGVSVGANDVGAINFYADIDCLDLTGLADREVFALKKIHQYSTSALSNVAAERKVRIAMVYETWFSVSPLSGGLGGPPLPSTWIRVARWNTPHGEFLGGGLVSFFATDPASAAELHDALARFAPSLPPQVQVLWR